MGVHTHCPHPLSTGASREAPVDHELDKHAHPLSTGASREAPVDNRCAHPLSTPIFHRSFARSTCEQWVCTPIVDTHCPHVLRAKHLWTIDVHTHCPHPLSTPIVRTCFARSTCGQWMCTPIVHTHCPCSTPIHPQGIYPHPRYSLFGVHAQVSSIFSNTNCSHTAGASRVP